MPYKINKFIKQELSIRQLRTFLESKELPFSGKFEHLIERIESEFNSDDGVINSNEVHDLLKNAAKFGNRRMYYISKINRASIQSIKSKALISKVLCNISPYNNSNDFNDLNLDKNNLDSLIENDLFILEYLNTTYDELDLVIKIELGYSYTREAIRKNDDGTELKFTYKDYFWIEINFKTSIICIHLPSFPEHFGNSYTNNTLFTHFYKKLSSDFGFVFENMSESNKLLYTIFKDIISVSEEPFKKRMENHSALLPQISKIIDENKVLQETSYPQFEERLQDLIERLIIQENFKEYLEYSKGKDGIISQMQYTDETGASVNATTGSTKKKGTIELCDVFFDTRKTINDNEKVDILFIDWFLDYLMDEDYNEENDDLKGEPDEPTEVLTVPKITTKFVSSDKYLLMHFRRQLLTEEVVTHVLSKLRNYPEFRW